MTDNISPQPVNAGGKGIVPFQLNQKLAYKGKIGRLRQQYCLEELRYMKVCHQKISHDQDEYVKARGETISCIGKGCSHCCSLYIGATLQECEAIVYYLYDNEALLDMFLKKGAIWRETVKQGGDSFRDCEKLFNEMLKNGGDQRSQRVLEEAQRRHNCQKIVCPFLENGICLIYEVRPSNCAGLFTTTSPESCRIPDRHEAQPDPRFNITTIEDVTYDVSFYYGNLKHPVTLYMPVAVSRILQEGLAYLARFAGLEGLDTAALNDPEIQSINKTAYIQ